MGLSGYAYNAPGDVIVIWKKLIHSDFDFDALENSENTLPDSLQLGRKDIGKNVWAVMSETCDEKNIRFISKDDTKLPSDASNWVYYDNGTITAATNFRIKQGFLNKTWVQKQKIKRQTNETRFSKMGYHGSWTFFSCQHVLRGYTTLCHFF